mmetsp:Transcript_53842/g.78642  ORF Transcript_53842/g.78642 Transcript_53842/m.78642 type:complete len:113 (+) Transcript_53842:513-851(+)
MTLLLHQMIDSMNELHVIIVGLILSFATKYSSVVSRVEVLLNDLPSPFCSISNIRVTGSGTFFDSQLEVGTAALDNSNALAYTSYTHSISNFISFLLLLSPPRRSVIIIIIL